MACQLVHAAIRKAAKGEGAMHNAPELVLLAVYKGINNPKSRHKGTYPSKS